MGNSVLTCPVCAHQFDPGDQVACQGCPLQKGCQLVCCPACGIEVVNIEQSTLARLANRLFFMKRTEKSPGYDLNPKE